MFFCSVFFVNIENVLDSISKKTTIEWRNTANEKKIAKILVQCTWIMKDGVPHFRHQMLGGQHKEQLDWVYIDVYSRFFGDKFGVEDPEQLSRPISFYKVLKIQTPQNHKLTYHKKHK